MPCRTFIDPFGAPEYWIDVVSREIASPGVLRMYFGARDGDENILKLKLLVPMAVMIRERQITDDFVAAHTAQVRRVSGA